MINYKDSLFVFSSKAIIIIIIIIIIITLLEEVRWGGGGRGPNGTHISMKHHQSLIRTID